MKEASSQSKTTAATKRALLSDASREAFGVAEYRLRKNARYAEWSRDRRWAYCMAKAFDAAVIQEAADAR